MPQHTEKYSLSLIVYVMTISVLREKLNLVTVNRPFFLSLNDVEVEARTCQLFKRHRQMGITILQIGIPEIMGAERSIIGVRERISTSRKA